MLSTNMSNSWLIQYKFRILFTFINSRYAISFYLTLLIMMLLNKSVWIQPTRQLNMDWYICATKVASLSVKYERTVTVHCQKKFKKLSESKKWILQWSDNFTEIAWKQSLLSLYLYGITNFRYDSGTKNKWRNLY
jgi:hypothetical protein